MDLSFAMKKDAKMKKILFALALSGILIACLHPLSSAEQISGQNENRTCKPFLGMGYPLIPTPGPQGGASFMDFYVGCSPENYGTIHAVAKFITPDQREIAIEITTTRSQPLWGPLSKRVLNGPSKVDEAFVQQELFHLLQNNIPNDDVQDLWRRYFLKNPDGSIGFTGGQ